MALLPKEQCVLLEEKALSFDETAQIARLRMQVEAGNESEFDDWEDVKDSL